MTCLGYLRASTDKQNIEHGVAEIDEFARRRCLGDVVYYKDEGVSGNAEWTKRKIADAVAKASRNDWIVVQEMSRLSRRPFDVLTIQDALRKKGVYLHAVKENITWHPREQDETTDTQTMLYAMFSQMERGKISQRVKTGIARVKGQRDPPRWGKTTVEHIERRKLVQKEHEGCLSMPEIAEKLHLARRTVSRDLWVIRNAGCI
jgi:DNA invertase Pin-like site-specific DNA recombinase